MYDDDRPGTMRVHIAQQRADALCAKYTRYELQKMAEARGLTPFNGWGKESIAFDLALDGVKA